MKSKLFYREQIIDQSLETLILENGLSFEEFMHQLKVIDNRLCLLIGGGISAERKVSYETSHAVMNALIHLGYKVLFIDIGTDIGYILKDIKPEFVFIGLHGTYGEDGRVQGLLDLLNIPYTGSGVLSSAISFDKEVSKNILKAHAVPIIEGIIIDKSDKLMRDPIPRPYVIKPLSQGSSIGVDVIFDEDQFNFAEYQYLYGDRVIIEPYIKGREMQVAIVDGKVIGFLEIKLLHNKRIYDYETKYTEGFAIHDLNPRLFPIKIQEKMFKYAETAYRVMHCKGLVRAEFIYEEHSNNIYMLELNSLPGMTKTSICPEIAAHKGIDFNRLIQIIISKADFD